MGQPGHRLLTAIGNIRRFGQGRIIQSLIEDIKRLFYSFFGISLTYRERALSKNVAHYGPIEAFVYITLYVFMFPICLYQHNRSLCSYIDGQYMDRQVTCIILDKSIIQQIVHVTLGHMAVYGPVRHQKKYYMDLRSIGPYNIFLVTDRSIYCHMILSPMNYLLYI